MSPRKIKKDGDVTIADVHSEDPMIEYELD